MADYYLEQIERGYGNIDGYVCANCFDDIGIKEFIKDNLSSTECDFCDNNSDDLVAAPLEEVVGHIVSSIRTEWAPVDESGAPWDSEDKEYATKYVDFDDVLLQEDLMVDSSELFQQIVSSVDPLYWARPFGEMSGDEVLLLGWDRFKTLVKHKVRFVFYKVKPEAEPEWHDPYSYPPYTILEQLAERVEELDLISTIPKGERAVRARIHGEQRFHTVQEMGPPSAEDARYPNRMNPAGITMFYGSNNVETALAETIVDRKEAGVASVGVFETLDELLVLDLTNLPAVPSIFEEQRGRVRNALIFLHRFLDDFTRPVIKDDRVHIEYVPTQVVTEYFRHIFEFGGKHIDGIKFPSSRYQGGVSYALFLEPKHCSKDGDTTTTPYGPKKKLSLLTGETTWKRLVVNIDVVDY